MPRISKIQKRDGRVVKFTPQKIEIAIGKAVESVKGKNGELAKKLAGEVVGILEKRFAKKPPHVEQVQDIVEEVLIKNGLPKVAKSYILYRQKRTEIRESKKIFGIRDDLKLSINSMKVLERRYLLKDEKGKVIESPSQMFRRVSRAIAGKDSKLEKEFYELMTNLEFLPNSPTLMNAGTTLGQLSACFVIPVGDSLESIFGAIEQMAITHQSGGGTGFDFTPLRPRGDIVNSTKGVASGPVSFMRVFDAATEVIKQGGRRRGANMGILRYDHPDILEFITSKTKEGSLTNFNISVAVDDKFMKTVKSKGKYSLINPRNKKKVNELSARDVFDLIVTTAWRTGDPGIIFIDEINRKNPTPKLGKIVSTNPCGEVPLLPYESCNLGSINLSKMVKNRKIDWEKFENTIGSAVNFLDNVIDTNEYQLPEIEKMTKANRKIGLGVMGFAEMLIQLGIPYDSQGAVRTAEKLMKFIAQKALERSEELAKNKGSFPNFRGSVWQKKYKKLRNATLTTIAPTGSISIIAGCSSGIEPLFAVSFIRNVMEGTQLLEVNPLFEEIAKEKGFYSKELMTRIAKVGSVQEFDEIPKNVRRLFVTAFDISPEWHVKMQAAFQKYTHNAVSKTINLPHDATVSDVEKAYWLAYKLKCKGITVYRYGSRGTQVLYIGSMIGRKMGETLQYVSAESDYAGGCPTPYCPH